MTSKLFDMMCETQRWQELLDNATAKGIDLCTIRELCFSSKRNEVLSLIQADKYTIFPPHIARIPKDTPGEFREVYVNEGLDRIILTLINDCLSELFKEMIHPSCKSYQKGIGTQAVVKEIADKVADMQIAGQIGWKADFSKYFDNVSIDTIDFVLDTLECQLGFAKGKEPVINLLRRYYHQDLYFDTNGELQSKYQGLKQGCAVASFLANVCLYSLDSYMADRYPIYYRYSDDVVVLGGDVGAAIDEINTIIKFHGVSLNPKKVEPLYSDKWFKFLGFLIKGNQITLSPSRVKKFQKEVEKRTIKSKCKSVAAARRNITRFLYGGEYSWATSCLSTINVQKDIDELNKFLMDCIRACETGKKRIGGLGSVTNLPDRTILRGKGRNVAANKEKTGYIEQYISIEGMQKNLKICRPVYETVVRNMMR